MRLKPLTLALALFAFTPLTALADPNPGDACSPNGLFQRTGGAESSGVGNMMVCSGGTWKALIGFDGTANVNLNYAVGLAGDITSASLGASQNDYTPTGLATASVIRLTASTPINITGLTGGADGRVITLMNFGANAITLVDESASSTAANRFALTGNLALAPDQSTVLMYDSTNTRWRVIGADAGSGGGATTIDGLTDAYTVYGGDSNLIMGRAGAAALASTAQFNLFVGEGAGAGTSSGSTDYNSALGYHALNALTDGAGNTALGAEALNLTTLGGTNTAIGAAALYNNVAKGQNTAVGYSAMYYAHNTGTQSNSNNTALGYWALRGSATPASNTGTANVALGAETLKLATSGSNNVAIGYQAGDAIDAGGKNIVIGWTVDTSAAGASNELNIGNVLYGTGIIDGATRRIGIGTPTPQADLSLFKTSDTFLDIGIAGTSAGSGEVGLAILTKATASTTLGSASVKGWEVYANSDGHTTAAVRNDFVLAYWDGTAWIHGLEIDSLTGNLVLDGAFGSQKGCLRFDDSTDKLQFSHDCTTFSDMSTGGGTPGGANTQVQFNDGGAFGGDADHTWNKTTNVLTVTGQVSVTDRVVLGSTTGAAAPVPYVGANAGPPAAGLCDNNAERGRMIIDTTNNRLYVCNGATRGWDYVVLTN